MIVMNHQVWYHFFFFFFGGVGSDQAGGCP